MVEETVAKLGGGNASSITTVFSLGQETMAEGQKTESELISEQWPQQRKAHNWRGQSERKFPPQRQQQQQQTHSYQQRQNWQPRHQFQTHSFGRVGQRATRDSCQYCGHYSQGQERTCQNRQSRNTQGGQSRYYYQTQSQSRKPRFDKDFW